MARIRSHMKKTGTPWYRSSHNAWYVWHGGKQHPLAKGKENKAEAYSAFAKLLGSAAQTTAPAPDLSVAVLVSEYRVDLKKRVRHSTFVAYGCILDPFVKQFPIVDVRALKPDDLLAWVNGKKWSQTTRRYALTVVGSVIRWGIRTKRLKENPLTDLKRPSGKSRGAEILIGSELHERLLGVVSPEFGRFVTAVRESGARPGEVARLTAGDIVWGASCGILSDHKTADKTGRERIIRMTPKLLTLCKELAAKNPTGPLFLNTRGEPWKKTGWKQAMERAQKRLGIRHRPMVSGYRHQFATDALEAGVPDAHVAELLGHTSTAMIHKHYAHLGARARVLSEALNRVRKAG